MLRIRKSTAYGKWPLEAAPAALVGARGVSPVITRTASAAGSLRSRLIHLQQAPFHAISIEFSDRSGRIFAWSELDEAKPSRPSTLFIADHAGRRYLKSLVAKNLL